MDPDTALANLLDAIGRNDLADAWEALDALHGWVERGGFLPTLPAHVTMEVGR